MNYHEYKHDKTRMLRQMRIFTNIAIRKQEKQIQIWNRNIMEKRIDLATDIWHLSRINISK